MLEQQLEKYFNFNKFRPGQKEIVQAILDQKDVVALMPTGGGKSLCYQLPAIIQKNLTVVISPLIALMKDQVDSLQARGINATFLNSTLNRPEEQKRQADILAGKVKLLYIAPERLTSPRSQDFLSQLKVDLLAVDEAHCVSQWGHDFRPDYLQIKNYINLFRNRPAVAALTATATVEVRDDIVKRLNLKNPDIFIRGFDRPNLKFFVQSNIKLKERLIEVLRLIKSIAGSGIVYALTRKETENIAEYLVQNGIKAVAYHAGMTPNMREKVQNDFMENRYKVIVATVAFGMGVDKADIRFVIHAGMPKNLEGYYQEAGRAGRDGEKAFCILLHSKKDVSTHTYFIQMEKKEMLNQGKDWDKVRQLANIKYNRLDKMVAYVTDKACRRKIILKYFADPDLKNLAANCSGCDVCLNWRPKDPAVAVNETIISGSDNLSVPTMKAVSPDRLPQTVMDTLTLFKQNYQPEQIAKARSLGISTIYQHLVRGYLAGEELDFGKLIQPIEEKQILQAMAKAENYQRLRSIKEQLPDAISYEKIKLVIAKVQKIDVG